MKFRVDARFDDQTIELYAKMMVHMDFKFDKKKTHIFYIPNVSPRESLYIYSLYISMVDDDPWSVMMYDR